MRRRRHITCGLLVLGLLTAGLALAHIPEASWLLNRMAHKRGQMGLRQLKIELRCGEDGHRETLLLKVTGKVRREYADGRVDICNRGRCQRLDPDGKATPLPAWTYLQYAYFADGKSSSEQFQRLLVRMGVDLKRTTLSRIASRVAFVLGAKEWERDRPQFWLDKDLYLPVRLMAKDGNALVDISWRSWGSRSSGDWFPGELRVVRDGQVIQQCETIEVDANPKAPDTLFALPR